MKHTKKNTVPPPKGAPQTVFTQSANSKLSLKTTQIVGAALLRIERRDGVVKPLAVVKEGRKPSSVFYPYLTHDKDKALLKCNIDEARYLIGSIMVAVVRPKTQEVIQIRGFWPVQSSPSETDWNGQGHISAAKAIAIPAYNSQIRELLLRELLALKVKLEAFVEFAEVCQAINRAQNKLRPKRAAAV